MEELTPGTFCLPPFSYGNISESGPLKKVNNNYYYLLLASKFLRKAPGGGFRGEVIVKGVFLGPAAPPKVPVPMPPSTSDEEPSLAFLVFIRLLSTSVFISFVMYFSGNLLFFNTYSSSEFVSSFGFYIIYIYIYMYI